MPKKKDKPLSSWNEGPARSAILAFVSDVTRAGSPSFLAPEERVAVFDNDGTLWCEKPMPVELGFVLQRLAAMAAEHEDLRGVQPWKAALERDYAWLDRAVTDHYRGDDRGAEELLSGILRAFGGTTVEEYEASAHAFLHEARHPVLDRPLLGCVFQPMVELLRYLEAHDFTTFIASAGDRDFMRSAAWEAFNIPPERIIGSSSALGYREDDHGSSVVYLARPDVFDDGAAKPVRIWSRVGRRPALAVGNSNGDIQMLQFAGGKGRPALRLLLLHDDAAREFDYVAGAEKSLELAKAHGWQVVSMKSEWTSVFA